MVIVKKKRNPIFCSNCLKDITRHSYSGYCEFCGSDIATEDIIERFDGKYEEIDNELNNLFPFKLSCPVRSTRIQKYYKIDDEWYVLKVLHYKYYNEEFSINETKSVLNDIVKDYKKRLNYSPKETTEYFEKEIEKILLNKFKNMGFSHHYARKIDNGYKRIPEITNKHGTGTKVVATGLLGPIGYAATSGVKTRYKKEKIPDSNEFISAGTVKLLQNGLDIKYYRGDDVIKSEFGWEEIVKADESGVLLSNGLTVPLEINWVQDFKKYLSLILESKYGLTYEYHQIPRQKLLKKIDQDQVFKNIIQYVYSLINDNATGRLIEKKDEEPETLVESENRSIPDEIEKYYNLKEKGIITEDEFILKKKELLNS